MLLLLLMMAAQGVLKLLLAQQLWLVNHWVCLMTVQISVTTWGSNPGCSLAGWFLASHLLGASAAAVYLCTVCGTGHMAAAVQAARQQQLCGS
jgi:hypothetical protein